MDNPSNAPDSNSWASQFLYCPHCRGGNLLDATRCRWCRLSLVPDEPIAEDSGQEHFLPPVPLEQVFCPHCKGGNPPDGLRCMWCKRLLNVDAAAAELPPSRNLLDSYRRAVIDPSLLRYAAEVPNASWRNIWISLAIAATVSSIIAIVPMKSYDIIGILLEVLSSALAVPIWFFINSLLLYSVAKLFGGKGRVGIFKADFTTHAYLCVLVFTPFDVVSSIVQHIPSVGTYLTSLLSLYQLYLFYVVLQVSRQLDPSSARAAIICFVVVGILLLVAIAVIAVIGFVIYTAAQPGIFSRIGSSLNP